MMLIDRFERQVTYLRVSVTDRCNLRCVYCLPPEGVVWQPHSALLSYEEIVQVVRLAAQHGVRAVRLTGGEPLLRKNLPDLVAMIAAIAGIEDISLTTNGVLLHDQVHRLAAAGLKRINVSLDTLQPDKYARITRGGSLERIWQGLLEAQHVGLSPIKLNVVAMRGVNDDELPDLARLTLCYPWHVRFIEMMPLQNQAAWGDGLPDPALAALSIGEMMTIFHPLNLQPVENEVGSGPARDFRLPGARGRIGFISPLGEPFCTGCNRLRLTADGNLRPCLLHDIEVPIRDALRRGEDLLPYFRQALAEKPIAHTLNQDHRPSSGRCMMQIGG